MTASDLHALPDPDPRIDRGLDVGRTHFSVSCPEDGTVRLYVFRWAGEPGSATATLLQEMTPGQAKELALGLLQVAEAAERNG